jgi:hypothetical protein
MYCLRRFVGVSILFLLVAPDGRADVTITEESARMDGSDASTTRIYVTPERVRVDDLLASGEPGQAFFFDAASGVFRMVDFERRTYMEMTAAEIEQMSAQVNEALAGLDAVQAQIQAQLAGLPPEQRRLAEQALAGQLPQGAGAPAPETEYRLLGSGEAVGEWTAAHYEGVEAGQRVWEIWTIDWSDAGLAASDFAAFERLAEAMEGFTAQGGGSEGFLDLHADDDGPYSGLPVRRVAYANGEPELRFEITDIASDSLDPALFLLPEGLTRETIPQFEP